MAGGRELALGGLGRGGWGAALPSKAQAPQMDVSSLRQAGGGEQGQDKAQDRSGVISAAGEDKGASGCRTPAQD